MNTNTQESQKTIPVSITSSVQIEKPARRDFCHDIMLDTNGQIVSEREWKSKVDTGITGRALTNQLHRLGFVRARTFDAAQFDVAKSTYTVTKKNLRLSMINQAFSRIDVAIEPHIEKALKDLSPLFKNVSEKKTVAVFRNIIHIIASVKK